MYNLKSFDLHADIGYDIMQKKNKGYKENILKTYHLPKFEQGEIAYICMASFFDGHEDWTDMQDMIQSTKKAIQECEDVCLLLQAEDFFVPAKVHAIMSVEGMCGIKEHPREKIRWMYEQGVRLASFCWNDENALATGVKGDTQRGLTAMGKEALDEMVKLNMVIDVSHANEKTFWDILSHPKANIIASHSNVRGLCDHPRNLKNEQIEALLKRGTLIGMNTAPQFVHSNKEKQDVAHLVQHMVWLKEFHHNKVDSIAFGFDYMDFYEEQYDYLKGAKDCTQTGNILQEMRKYFSEEEIAAIAYRNACDYFKKIWQAHNAI